jgi:vancomycin aglycone glucosyltransferase
MRVLLTTIGSRGDVQPVVALALQLRELGQEVRVCAPPDFRDWVDTLGIPFTPVGPELSSAGKANPSAAPLTSVQRRQMAEASVAAQPEAATSSWQADTWWLQPARSPSRWESATSGPAIAR